MNSKTINVTRTNIVLKPDPSRVLLRAFTPGDNQRIAGIAARVVSLPDAQVAPLLDEVIAEFSWRHRHLQELLVERFEQVRPTIPDADGLSEPHRMLLASYFLAEYSIESAALFNPSLVADPDQSALPQGALRFILSLRATGEGHISSIVFRTGIIRADHRIEVVTPTGLLTEPRPIANSNYEVQFRPNQQLSERILFPATPSQRNGIEDARFVRFQNEDGTHTYFSTFTAFDGKSVRPELLETTDFLRFRFATLTGPAAQNKGMALFPRKINGQYAMLSRQDNESIYIMFSSDVHNWTDHALLLKPRFPWELVQLGNCGSPIETDTGWLVLSHGVGPMRKYSIGAFLLDRDDPTKVIGRLSRPLIQPNQNEREGYVPNVVYTCGAILHNKEVVIPYGLADQATGFATVPIDEILAAMVPETS